MERSDDDDGFDGVDFGDLMGVMDGDVYTSFFDCGFSKRRILSYLILF